MPNSSAFRKRNNPLAQVGRAIVSAVLQRRRASTAGTKGYEMICRFTLVERRERQLTEGTASNAISRSQTIRSTKLSYAPFFSEAHP